MTTSDLFALIGLLFAIITLTSEENRVLIRYKFSNWEVAGILLSFLTVNFLVLFNSWEVLPMFLRNSHFPAPETWAYIISALTLLVIIVKVFYSQFPNQMKAKVISYYRSLIDREDYGLASKLIHDFHRNLIQGLQQGSKEKLDDPIFLEILANKNFIEANRCRNSKLNYRILDAYSEGESKLTVFLNNLFLSEVGPSTTLLKDSFRGRTQAKSGGTYPLELFAKHYRQLEFTKSVLLRIYDVYLYDVLGIDFVFKMQLLFDNQCLRLGMTGNRHSRLFDYTMDAICSPDNRMKVESFINERLEICQRCSTPSVLAYYLNQLLRVFLKLIDAKVGFEKSTYVEALVHYALDLDINASSEMIEVRNLAFQVIGKNIKPNSANLELIDSITEAYRKASMPKKGNFYTNVILQIGNYEL